MSTEERFFVTPIRRLDGSLWYATARAVGLDRLGKIYDEPTLPPRRTRDEAQRDLDRWAKKNGLMME